MRVAHDELLVGIHVTEEHELAEQVLNQRIDVAGIETVPGIVRRTQRNVNIAADLGMIPVINLHVPPLAVVEFLGRAAAAVHSDDKGQPLGGRVPTVLTV